MLLDSEFILYSLFLAHSSKGHCDESRPELVFRLTVGNLCLSVLHIDPLPPPDSTLSPLAPMASEFFHMMANDQLHLRGFLQARAVFDQACPHDHLRWALYAVQSFIIMQYTALLVMTLCHRTNATV